MRVWDVPPAALCNRHLLAQHNEIHVIWNVITLGRRGFSRHPETLRWHGRLAALRGRHEATVGEMLLRGFRHLSPLPPAPGPVEEPEPLEPVEAQADRLRGRQCGCFADDTST
jgi:hypothetical protein